MTTNFIIAPNGRWSARNLVGDAAVNGLVFTYTNMTRTPKATYQDAAGITPNTNPVRLDSKGEANIYWATDEYYTIEIYQYNPVSGTYDQLIYSQDNYPVTGAGSSGDITIVQSFPNLVRNPQFTFVATAQAALGIGTGNIGYSNTIQTNFTNIGVNPLEVIALDWDFFVNSSQNASSIQISQQTFTPGQAEVPGNPISYLRYNCNGIGDGSETNKYISQSYTNVQTLSNSQISFGIWMRSSTSSPVTIFLVQDVGAGGSGGAAATILNVTLTPGWTQYTATFTMPNIFGSTIGVGSGIYLEIKPPLNAVAQIDMVNVQMHKSATLPAFPYLTYNDQIKVIDAFTVEGIYVTGDIRISLNSSASNGWVPCNDGTIGAYKSGATYNRNNTIQLYTLIWELIPNTLAPIYTSAGAVSTRGSSALADFNANKRLALTRMLGRVLGVSGAGAGLTARALGSFVGTETQTLVPANLPPHSHETYYVGIGLSNTANALISGNATPVAPTGDGSTLGLNSTPLSIMQPTAFSYAHLKL